MLDPRRLGLILATLALLPLLALRPYAPDGGNTPSTAVPADPLTEDSAAVLAVALAEDAFGRSGSLRTRLVHPGEQIALQLEWTDGPPTHVHYRWRPILGTPGDGAAGVVEPGDLARVPTLAGVYEIEIGNGMAAHHFGDALRVVVTVPFDRKRGGRIGPYHMGTWPTEGKGRQDAYAPPARFIEVTEENQSLRLSEHFTVGQFLTKDQASVWPKYVAVEPRLIDKLELVILELRAMGVQADRMVVMSGFRTPQYNHRHLGNSPSSLSRHQFGDAADVWVDNEDDWYMSDLNGDGRRDINDARVILEAVERVERRHPDLVGGAGLYRANTVRGPFIHIDVRGSRARW
jgi:hypothetical protein